MSYLRRFTLLLDEVNGKVAGFDAQSEVWKAGWCKNKSADFHRPCSNAWGLAKKWRERVLCTRPLPKFMFSCAPRAHTRTRTPLSGAVP